MFEMFKVEKSGIRKFMVGNSEIEIPGLKILGLKKNQGWIFQRWVEKNSRVENFGVELRCHATFLRTFLAVMVQNEKIIYIAHHNIQF